MLVDEEKAEREKEREKVMGREREEEREGKREGGSLAVTTFGATAIRLNHSTHIKPSG